MNLVRWTRFTWDLNKLPPLENALRQPYALRAAARQEEALVAGVIHSAFSLDSDWSDKFNLFREPLQHQLRVTFERETIPALVITHGQRIIGASILNTDVDADSHLLSGPCVLVEYRNRGLGTVLLYYSLKQLQNAGLSVVHGVSKDNVPAAKFIYPKFGARRVVWEFEPALTAH